jgi:hypothetical protein
MRPLTASPARTALPAAHFDRNERFAYFGDRALAWATTASVIKIRLRWKKTGSLVRMAIFYNNVILLAILQTK